MSGDWNYLTFGDKTQGTHPDPVGQKSEMKQNNMPRLGLWVLLPGPISLLAVGLSFSTYMGDLVM